MNNLTTIIIQNNASISNINLEYLTTQVKSFSNNFFVLSNNSNTEYTFCQSEKDFIKECNNVAKNVVGNLLILSTSDFNVDYFNEMNSILSLSERHAAVSPRGSNIGLLSVPIDDRDSFQKNIDYSYNTYLKIKDFLPKYHIAPYLTSICILINGRLIKRLRFLDENSKNLNDAITSWCLNISSYGFSSIVANKVFIKNSYFIASINNNEDITNQYLDYKISIYDNFASLLENSSKPKVLVSLYHITNVYNGSSMHALSMLKNLINNFSDKYEFHILTYKEVAKFFNLDKFSCKIVYPDTITEKYHIGITTIQISNFDIALILNKHCLKIIQNTLDLITYRCYSLYSLDFVFDKTIKYSDSIITISEFTKNDLLSAYPHLNKNKIYSIPLALPEHENKSLNNKKYKIPFKNYILILGNFLPHKAIDDVLKIVPNINYNFVLVGYKLKSKYKNIISYTSGTLSDNHINFLYENCDALLYPSQYEGFGLPVVQTLQFGKKVIVCNSEMNKELLQLHYDLKDNFLFFETFDEIKSIIENTDLKTVNKASITYTYKDVAIETEKIISNTLKEDINFTLLEERYNVISAMNITPPFYNLIMNIFKTLKYKFPKIFSFMKKVYFLMIKKKK